jgi:GNAT superfamily N-acetyltransferase
MLTFKQFLTEEVVISPVTAKRPKMAAGGIDRARNMLASALNNTDRGVKRLMAVEDGQIVGAISYYADRKKWIIDRVGSLKKGVGTMLMKQVIDAARKAGADRIELWATETSDSFYDRFGFEDTGNTGVGEGHKVLVLTTS